MIVKKEKNKKEGNKDIEIVVGDDSVLDISEVNDYDHRFAPDVSKEKKKVIIPVEKKKKDKNK